MGRAAARLLVGVFHGLGRIGYRGRWPILVIGLLLFALSAPWGAGVFERLTDVGFDDPRSESAQAQRVADTAFGRTDADVLIAYQNVDGHTVDDARVRQTVTRHVATLAPWAERISTYWSTGSSALVSHDRRAALVAITLRGADLQARQEAYQDMRPHLPIPRFVKQVGGAVPLAAEVGERSRGDIQRAELISAPLLAIALVIVFRTVVAAAVPLLIGAYGVVGALAVLRVLTALTAVSPFAVSVVTMLGLGLAIDYSLLIVSRFREERAAAPTREAIVMTIATAGRTVAFSGVTVAVALTGLLPFAQPFLRSLALGGLAVVVFDLVAALTVLPALLAVLGPRVDALSLRRFLGEGRRGTEGDGWARVARAVMRHPVAYICGVVAVLAALGAPFLGARFGALDARVLPAGSPSRTATAVIAAEFPPAPRLDVVVTGTLDRRAVLAYLNRLRTADGVTRAEPVAVAPRYPAVRIAVDTAGEDAAARSTVAAVREVRPPPGAQVLVGGPAARWSDLMDTIGATLPYSAAWVLGVTALLMLVVFGSYVLPIKAVLMNVVSMTASFGVIVQVFQHGHLSGALGFTPTGVLEPTNLVLILIIVYGLSLDYEVFLLSRIREEWDRTRDNTRAVATGLQRSGGLITSAAALLLVVVGAFCTADVAAVKLVGVGVFVAVAVDASLVRVLLVPATMRLLGAANWWRPGPRERRPVVSTVTTSA